MQLDTLNIDQLAELLHLAKATVRADVSRRPWMLPPFVKVGTKTVWLRDTVMDWLKAREQAATPPAAPEPPPQPKRRGRPSKIALLQRQQRAATEVA